MGGSSYIVIPKYNSPEYGVDSKDVIKADAISAEPENSIDVLIIGDSETFLTYSPMLMWSYYGFTSYVMGTSKQNVYQSYCYLLRALKTQSPKVVVLEANAIFRSLTVGSAAGYFLRNKIPAIRFHNRWKKLQANDFYGKVSFTWTDDFKGFYMRRAVVPYTRGDYMGNKNDLTSIGSVSLFFLNKITRLCKERGIKFVIDVTPTPNNWTYGKHNSVYNYTLANQIPFIDMNTCLKQVGINWTTDSLDGGDHLNYSGAVKATLYLAEFLDDEYSLEDHRSDDSYVKWQEALKDYNFIASNSGKGG